ncbi:unnamed protein product [Mucor hiemalis]
MQRSVNLTKTCFRPSNPLLNHSGSKSITTIVTRPMSSLSTVASSEPLYVNGEAPNNSKKQNVSLRKLIFNNAMKSATLSSGATNVIRSQLKPWENFDKFKVIIVKGNSDNTVSISNEYKEILDLSDNEKTRLLNAIQTQNNLFYSIAHLKTAYVAIMDGVTMGEGAALSIHGGFRVATENTRLSVPELSIGVTPNAGSNYYMSRLDGQLGTYLTLTGQPMSGKDLFFSGLATHYVPSSSIPDMEHHLTLLNCHDCVEDVNDMIEKFSLPSVEPSTDSFLKGSKRDVIEKCFNYDTIDEIIIALENDGSDFALETKNIISSNSPAASEIALENLRKAKYMTIAECLEIDFENQDFKESTVEKTQPNGNNKFSNGSTQAHFLDSILTVDQSGLGLPLQSLFKPSYKFALPTEDDIRRYAVGLSSMKQGFLRPAASFEEVVNHFVTEKKNKSGVTEKVKEVLERKARIIQDKLGGSVVEWNYSF